MSSTLTVVLALRIEMTLPILMSFPASFESWIYAGYEVAPWERFEKSALRLDCAAIQSDLKVQSGKRTEARRVQNRLLHHLCNAAEAQMIYSSKA